MKQEASLSLKSVQNKAIAFLMAYVGPELVAYLPTFWTTTPIVKEETCISSLYTDLWCKWKGAQRSKGDETKNTTWEQANLHAHKNKKRTKHGLLRYRHLEYRAKTNINSIYYQARVVGTWTYRSAVSGDSLTFPAML